MKLRELLCERISVSSHTHVLQNEISDIIHTVNNRISKQFTLPAEGKEYQAKMILMLNSALSRFLSEQADAITKGEVIINFTELENGTGSYVHETGTLSLSRPLLINIAQLAVQIKYAPSKQDVANSMLNAAISKLVKLFLHEITHVIQLKAAGKPYEKSKIHNKQGLDDYLSSINLKSKKQQSQYNGDPADLNKNRLNVFLARNDMANPKNVDVYLGQPEEVSAYAQEIVSDFATTLLNKPKTTQLKAIADFANQIKTNSVKTPYSKMAASTDPTYQKVYRRFVKQVYQELQSFKESLR